MIRITWYVTHHHGDPKVSHTEGGWATWKDARSYAQAAVDGGVSEVKIRMKIEFSFSLWSWRKS